MNKPIFLFDLNFRTRFIPEESENIILNSIYKMSELYFMIHNYKNDLFTFIKKDELEDLILYLYDYDPLKIPTEILKKIT